MSRYTLEVTVPFLKDLPDDEDQLASALDAIAIVHGGMVVESAKASAKAYQRQYITLFAPSAVAFAMRESRCSASP